MHPFRTMWVLAAFSFAVLGTAVAGATEIRVVTPNPDSANLSSVSGDGATGYAAYPGPTFRLFDDQGKPVAGRTLYFFCNQGVYPCPKMLSNTAKTDNTGTASMSFPGPFSVQLPAFPPGRGALVGGYNLWASLCAEGTNCISSPIVKLHVLCTGPFVQCVGASTGPTGRTGSTGTSGSSGSTGRTGVTGAAGYGALTLVSATPVAVVMKTTICSGKACYFDFPATVQVKLTGADGKPVPGVTLNLDLGTIAGSPWDIGAQAATDKNGVATLSADFGFDPRSNKSGFTKGSKFNGRVTAAGAAYAKLSLDVGFVVE